MTPHEARLYVGSNIRAVLRDVDTGDVTSVTMSLLAVNDDSVHIAYNGQTLWMKAANIIKIPSGVRESPGNWLEDFAHENGCYMCKCFTCGNIFHGHKRRAVCKVCSMNPEEVAPPKEERSPLPIGGCHHVAAWVWEDTGGIFWASRLTSEHQAKVTVGEWVKRGPAPKGIQYKVLALGVITDETSLERINYWKRRALIAEAQVKQAKVVK